MSATLVAQQKSINSLKMIVMALLTDWELEILGNLIKETGTEYKLTPKPNEISYELDKRTIVRLIGLGFLELAVPGQGFGYWKDRYNAAPNDEKPVIRGGRANSVLPHFAWIMPPGERGGGVARSWHDRTSGV